MYWGCVQRKDYTDKPNNDTHEYKVSRRNIKQAYSTKQVNPFSLLIDYLLKHYKLNSLASS